MKKQYLEVGKIVNTHGLAGEMKLQLWCDGIDFLKNTQVLYLDDQGNSSVKVTSLRPQKTDALIRLDDVNTIENAQLMRNAVLYIKRDDVEIKEGKYFIQDLIDCKVVDLDNGEEYGTIVDVTNTGASDIYNVKRENGELLLIPVIEEIVKEIDLEKAVVKIKVMKGLFLDED